MPRPHDGAAGWLEAGKGNGYLLTSHVQMIFWLFLYGIRVRVRLKVPLKRLTLGVLHAFVLEWLASSHRHGNVLKAQTRGCVDRSWSTDRNRNFHWWVPTLLSHTLSVVVSVLLQFRPAPRKNHQNDHLRWPNFACSIYYTCTTRIHLSRDQKIIINAWNRSKCVGK